MHQIHRMTRKESELRKWLDGDSEPLPWSYEDRTTADEWFFISTLYGEMTLDGQWLGLLPPCGANGPDEYLWTRSSVLGSRATPTPTP